MIESKGIRSNTGSNQTHLGFKESKESTIKEIHGHASHSSSSNPTFPLLAQRLNFLPTFPSQKIAKLMIADVKNSRRSSSNPQVFSPRVHSTPHTPPAGSCPPDSWRKNSTSARPKPWTLPKEISFSISEFCESFFFRLEVEYDLKYLCLRYIKGSRISQ